MKKVLRCIALSAIVAVISFTMLAIPAFAEDIGVTGSSAITTDEVKAAMTSSGANVDVHTYTLLDNNVVQVVDTSTSSANGGSDIVYYYWYDDSGKLQHSQYVNGSLSYTTVSSDSAQMGDIVTRLSSGVVGVYGMASKGFNFISGNDMCLVMVGLSFAGAGIGLVGRAFKTSRK